MNRGTALKVLLRHAAMLAVATLALAGAAREARADTILLEQSGLISGHQSFVYSFATPGSGTLSVRLSNLDWPERLASLSFALTTATGVLHSVAEPGDFSFDIGTAGALYAHVAGTAQGSLDLGLFSLRISFQPAASPVPLPAGIWMLLAGIATTGGLMRRKARDGRE